jgi:hypothetical protein
MSLAREERRVVEMCPGCGTPILVGSLLDDWEPVLRRRGLRNVYGLHCHAILDDCDAVFIGDVITDPMECPKCGGQLLHTVIRQWEDSCMGCGRKYRDEVFPAVTEWQKDKHLYRWMCGACYHSDSGMGTGEPSGIEKCIGMPVGLAVLFLLNEELQQGRMLLEALAAVMQSLEKSPFASAVREIACAVESGWTLADGLSKHPGLFPAPVVDQIRKAQEAGLLFDALEDVSRCSEQNHEQQAARFGSTRLHIVM